MFTGINVELLVKEQTGVDDFGAPIYSERWETVGNVLPGQPTTDDITTAKEMHGRKAVYALAIPKNDNHNWEDTRVRFFGEEFATFGKLVKTIDKLTPTVWNGRIMCEVYNG